KDFYIVFPRSAYGDSRVYTLINSPVKQTAVITRPDGFIDTLKMQFNDYIGIYASPVFHIEDSSEVVDKHGATRIQTTTPVSVLGQYGTTGISGTYNAMPVSTWGTEYYVIDEVEGENPPILTNTSIFSVPQITIIAAQDSTTVKITPTAATAKGNQPGIPFTVKMNAGDVYYISDAADPQATPPSYDPGTADFSGTHIVSINPKKPIGVIVSQSYTADPYTSTECGNFGMQWLPPFQNWDSTYIITPTPNHDTTHYYDGELLRMVFEYDGTTVHRTSAGSDSILGTFFKGDVYTYKVPMQAPFVLSANLPFLPMEITSAPLVCNEGNVGTKVPYSFSMMIPVGTHQWSDFIPFSTADLAMNSDGVIYFRTQDLGNLYFNGVPLKFVSPKIDTINSEYSYIPFQVGADSYYEIRGDSGATAGGAVWGYGQSQINANNGNNNTHTLDPEMVKSFAHPIGLSAINFSNPDTTPPRIVVHFNCTGWTDTVSDAERFSSGLNDIELVENFAPDSSYNVTFAQTPVFSYGTNQPVGLQINILDLTKPAAVALHIRDNAGNERDTVMTYSPSSVYINPYYVGLGPYLPNSVDSSYVTITDTAETAVTITDLKLTVGKHWQILQPPKLPLTLQPGDDVVIYVTYATPSVDTPECDYDTVSYQTACYTKTAAILIGCLVQSTISAVGYDFGCIPRGSEKSSPARNNGVYLTNITLDTVTILSAQMSNVNNTASDDSVFTLNGFYDRQGNTLQYPSFSSPWKLPPVQTGGTMDTIFIQVSAHPHTSTGE
ncbi:MAG TPA: IgGFc-binding protein, partial [Candidatus Kapabacteria bacterium]|nr:IgGFc-binding protein [Candidatus Kapabacteria bacterium]